PPPLFPYTTLFRSRRRRRRRIGDWLRRRRRRRRRDKEPSHARHHVVCVRRTRKSLAGEVHTVERECSCFPSSVRRSAVAVIEIEGEARRKHVPEACDRLICEQRVGTLAELTKIGRLDSAIGLKNANA